MTESDDQNLKGVLLVQKSKISQDCDTREARTRYLKPGVKLGSLRVAFVVLDAKLQKPSKAWKTSKFTGRHKLFQVSQIQH